MDKWGDYRSHFKLIYISVIVCFNHMYLVSMSLLFSLTEFSFKNYLIYHRLYVKKCFIFRFLWQQLFLFWPSHWWQWWILHSFHFCFRQIKSALTFSCTERQQCIFYSLITQRKPSRIELRHTSFHLPKQQLTIIGNSLWDFHSINLHVLVFLTLGVKLTGPVMSRLSGGATILLRCLA